MSVSRSDYMWKGERVWEGNFNRQVVKRIGAPKYKQNYYYSSRLLQSSSKTVQSIDHLSPQLTASLWCLSSPFAVLHVAPPDHLETCHINDRCSWKFLLLRFYMIKNGAAAQENSHDSLFRSSYTIALSVCVFTSARNKFIVLGKDADFDIKLWIYSQTLLQLLTFSSVLFPPLIPLPPPPPLPCTTRAL